jgi:hypothetical protein
MQWPLHLRVCTALRACTALRLCTAVRFQSEVSPVWSMQARYHTTPPSRGWSIQQAVITIAPWRHFGRTDWSHDRSPQCTAHRTTGINQNHAHHDVGVVHLIISGLLKCHTIANAGQAPRSWLSHQVDISVMRNMHTFAVFKRGHTDVVFPSASEGNRPGAVC